MVGAVGETASMKRRKLWKTGEDGLCCSSSAIQTRLDPSSLLEGRSETPIVFLLFLLCCWLPPKLGETAKVYRIDFFFYVQAAMKKQEVLTLPCQERTKHAMLGEGQSPPSKI